MKVVTRTGDYTIYKKRNQRYAVRDKNRQWVRGDDKAAILLAHNLMPIKPQLKAPDVPEATPEEAAAAPEGAAEASSEGGEGDGGEAEPS